MHQTISERWNRISLRTKITGVTVLMLTLGLLVSGIGTAAMLRSYVEGQLESKLSTIASGDLRKYFTDDGQEPSANADLKGLDFGATADDVFIAIYDSETGRFVKDNWTDRSSAPPRLPRTLTQADVYAQNNGGGYTVFAIRDTNGDPTFRGV